MVLDVHGAPLLVLLDVRGPVEVGGRDGQPLRSGLVGEGPADRVRDGEDPAAAGAQHAVDLPHDVHRVGDEGDCAVRGAGEVEGAVAEGQPPGVGLDQRYRPAVDAQGVLELAVGEVQGHRAGALGGQPAGALGGTGADLQDVLALEGGGRAEEAGLGLVQSLGAPDEAVVAEERAVLDLVLVGVAVPPAAARPAALRFVGVTPGGHGVVRGVVVGVVRVFGDVVLLVHGARRRSLRKRSGGPSGSARPRIVPVVR